MNRTKHLCKRTIEKEHSKDSQPTRDILCAMCWSNRFNDQSHGHRCFDFEHFNGKHGGHGCMSRFGIYVDRYSMTKKEQEHRQVVIPYAEGAALTIFFATVCSL